MGEGTTVNYVLDNVDRNLSFWKSGLLGIVISIIGGSTFGVINLMVVQMSVERDWISAALFSLGCGIPLFIFVRYSVVFTQWITKKRVAKKIFDWTSLVLFSALAIGCFTYTGKNLRPDISLPAYPAFAMGVVVRILYPSMVPYWLGWNAAFISRKMNIKPISFAVGALLGMVFMHGCYIGLGQLAVNFIEEKSLWIMWLLGTLLFLTACMHGFRMYKEHTKIEST